MMMKKNKLLVASCAAFVLFTGCANAQSIDYTTMQDMFGEPVTTSANGSPMRQSEAPMDMTIISAADIARYPAREIPDILRFHTGISVRQAVGSTYATNVRGYNTPGTDRLLVLVNGRQVYEDFYGLVNWGSIPVNISDIQQIEVVRGPNTALFGFNAVSGVVNIVTKNPLYDSVNYLEVDAGNNQNKRANGAVTFRHDDKLGVRVSVGQSRLGIDDPTISSIENGSYHDLDRTGDVNVDTVLKINDKTTMRFEASATDVEQNDLTAYYDGGTVDEDTASFKSDLSSDTDFGIIDFTFYKNGLDSVYRVASGRYGFDNNVAVARISDTFQIGANHTFRIAGEYRDNADTMSLNGNEFFTNSYHIQSLSGLWYWNATPKLSVSTAVRYDHAQADYDGSTLFGGGLYPGNPFTNDQYNNRYDEFGYNIGALYKLTDKDSMRFNISKGIQMPSLFETGFQVVASGLSYYADPNIRASDVHDFQIGYDRKLDVTNGAFKATAFYQQIDDLHGFVPVSSVRAYTGNIGESKIYGIELGLDGQTDNNIRWGLNYSYSRIQDDISTTVDYEDQNSDHMVKANIGYSPTPKWDMDLYGSYESGYTAVRDINNVNTNLDIDANVIIDARVAYKPTEKWTLSLNGQSIFDGDDTGYGVEPDAQVFFRAKYGF